MNDWISTEKELPAESEEVLLLCRSFYEIGYWWSIDDDRYWSNQEGLMFPFTDVTHWMPLPELPNEKL